MQKAETILSILKKQSENDKNFVFQRLYRNLFNQNFYEMAYTKLYAENTVFNKEMVGLSKKEIDETIFLFQMEKYCPYDEKINKIVFEIINTILENVYSPLFHNSRDYRALLLHIKNNCRNQYWVINGNASTTIENEILLQFLKQKIDDGRFILLINKLIPYGFLENSHILTSIYFHALDIFASNIIEEYECTYARYKNNFLLFSKNKTISHAIKSRINLFIEETYKTSDDNSKVFNLSDNNILFLDYEISHKQKNEIKLLVPGSVINKMVRPFIKERKPIHCNKRLNLPVLEIIKEYNKEIEALYSYYSIADDKNSKIRKFRYYHYYSLAKTIALKEKTSVKRVMQKYAVGPKKIIGVPYETLDGSEILTYFNSNA